MIIFPFSASRREWMTGDQEVIKEEETKVGWGGSSALDCGSGDGEEEDCHIQKIWSMNHKEEVCLYPL